MENSNLDETLSVCPAPKKIQKLDEVTINRIAAGEVVQRPANALKELLENSLDAGCSSIQIIVKSGGLKMLQIIDDGSGIRREDLPIVCERFTTSKLEKFEDLQVISTYGFRGEALASISHVAHLSIVTKTGDSKCAFRADYSDGKLKLDENHKIKPCAGLQGTTITVEDLFYNMETRRKAVKSVADEHNKIVDVVTRYAIHNWKVGFSLKKAGETSTDVRTPSKSSALDNIKLLFGAQIARELTEVSCEDKVTAFQMNGYISNVNYSTKKPTFILFINNRLVESTALKRSIDSLYSSYLPKGSHPYVYLSIQIDSRNVDVNVHPTKHEVHFLHEDVIISSIATTVENCLLGSNQSRTYYVQSLLPGAAVPVATSIGSSRKRPPESPGCSQDSANASSQLRFHKDSPKTLVRTDPKMQKLDKFLTSTPNPDTDIQTFGESPSRISISSSQSEGSVREVNTVLDQTSIPTALPKEKKNRDIRLQSVRAMKGNVERDCHNGLLTLFKNHTFVGCVDRSRALVQHDTKLYMVNTFKLSAELFYQKILYAFGNFGQFLIDDPVAIIDLVRVALQDEYAATQTAEAIELKAGEIQALLMSKAKMLDDYFSLTFDGNKLMGIPMLLENYVPFMSGIPNYLVNLARNVNWQSEQACFETFAHQTALFYAIPPGGDHENDELALNGHTYKWTIEHLIYPEIMKCLQPPNKFAEDNSVLLLANLPDLYKVFERC